MIKRTTMETKDYKTEIENLIDELKSGEPSRNKIITRNYAWYKKATFRNLIAWYALQFITVLSGFLTSILVALSNNEYLNSKTWKIILIILPAIGSFAYTIIIQFRVYELWNVRDKGRFMYNNLYAEFYGQLLLCKSEDEYKNLFNKIIRTTSQIEQEQSLAYTRLFGNSDAKDLKNNEVEKIEKIK